MSLDTTAFAGSEPLLIIRATTAGEDTFVRMLRVKNIEMTCKKFQAPKGKLLRQYSMHSLPRYCKILRQLIMSDNNGRGGISVQRVTANKSYRFTGEIFCLFWTEKSCFIEGPHVNAWWRIVK